MPISSSRFRKKSSNSLPSVAVTSCAAAAVRGQQQPRGPAHARLAAAHKLCAQQQAKFADASARTSVLNRVSFGGSLSLLRQSSGAGAEAW
jgi:hypothetical protein